VIELSKVKDAYKEIENAIGAEYITDKDFMKAAYSRNVDPAFPDRWADIIVRPETTEEVSEIVKIANKYKIKMVPRGGGADLVGGSVTEGGILIDLTRMNKILEINEDDYYCVVECGITWGNLVSILHTKEYTTGVLGPGSGYAATIGGGLSNATAGFGSTKYGLVPDICLGVEVVLPNPQGTIIRTGAAANKYATPFCRYGVAPDFTGLFMGDVGTMGIKTKAFLRLFPYAPYRAQRNYIFNKNDWQKVFEKGHELRKQVGDAICDLVLYPLSVVLLASGNVDPKFKPPKRPKLKGPVFSIRLEAFDQRIMDIYLEQIDKIMTKDEVARPFEFQEVNLEAELSKNWKFTLKYGFNFFHWAISPSPTRISLTTCHKIPISTLPGIASQSGEFYKKHKEEFPPGNVDLLAMILMFLPNGNLVVVGGMHSDNVDEEREAAMNIWHKKLRYQVHYGGVHYWLGESISQSIVEAGAYTPDFMQFFRDMKKTVDPNFLLSPNKFHMYTYDYDYTKHLIKDDE
jgi:FAD/FMN-containing dehydrogenase